MWNTERMVRPAGILFVAGLLIGVSGCSPIPDFGSLGADEVFATGKDAADRGDYLVAIEAFRRVTEEFPLDALADDALVALGDAYRAAGDYASAEAEYQRVFLDYSFSPLAAEAEFKLGLAYFEQALPSDLDQSMTARAIGHLSLFIEKYPESGFVDEAREKVRDLRSQLALKLYDAAMLYFKLGRSDAARVYLQAIAREYPDTVWARTALLDEARSLAREGLSASADKAYQDLIERYPGTEEADLAQAERTSS